LNATLLLSRVRFLCSGHSGHERGLKLVTRAYLDAELKEQDQIGILYKATAIFGRGCAAEPDVLIEPLRKDQAIAAAETILLTVPNQLSVACNAHVIEAILTTVAPALGWR
jgi:hypothetical protein